MHIYIYIYIYMCVCIYITGTEKGLKRDDDSAYVQTNNGGPEKMEEMIMTSLCDIMRISHARKGREVYKESTTQPQGCCYCCLGVPVQSIWVC